MPKKRREEEIVFEIIVKIIKNVKANLYCLGVQSLPVTDTWRVLGMASPGSYLKGTWRHQGEYIWLSILVPGSQAKDREMQPSLTPYLHLSA